MTKAVCKSTEEKLLLAARRLFCPVYEADVKQPDGKKIEIKVGEDGKLIKIDKD